MLLGVHRRAGEEELEQVPPPPSLPYKVDTSHPYLRTNWTRLGEELEQAPAAAPDDGAGAGAGVNGSKGAGAGGGQERSEVAVAPPPPLPPVLTGHASSLVPY